MSSSREKGRRYAQETREWGMVSDVLPGLRGGRECDVLARVVVAEAGVLLPISPVCRALSN